MGRQSSMQNVVDQYLANPNAAGETNVYRAMSDYGFDPSQIAAMTGGQWTADQANQWASSMKSQYGYAEGGMVQEGIMPQSPMSPEQDQQNRQLMDMTVAAIMGMVEDPAPIINAFIAQYGERAFLMLREQVLQQQAGGQAQTQGLIPGQSGGMDDQVPGTTGDGQGIAVSPGEYIVPADVVSGLGDGNTQAGAAQLDQMMGRVRQAKTGGVVQPGPINHRQVMPA